MTNLSVGSNSRSGLTGLWLKLSGEEEHKGGPDCGRMWVVAGMKPLLKAMRAASPEEVVLMAS
jgi:hypothetical protein